MNVNTMSTRADTILDPQSPKDLKIKARRYRVWSQYLEGITQEEIAEREGVDRRTIYRDIQTLKNQMKEHPKTVESVYKETYEKIMSRIEKVQNRAEKAEKDSDSAKLWKVVADFDRLILEHFTPNESMEVMEKEKEDMFKQVKAMIDYLILKLGPEGLEDFEEYWTRRQALEKWK